MLSKLFNYKSFFVKFYLQVNNDHRDFCTSVLVIYIYFYTHKDNQSCISQFSVLPPLKTFSHVQLFRTHFFEPINLVFLAIYRFNPHIFYFLPNNHNSWQCYFSPFLGNINKKHHYTFLQDSFILHIRNPDIGSLTQNCPPTHF